MVTQAAKPLFSDVQNAVTAVTIIFGETLKIIVNAGDDISQRIQRYPVGDRLGIHQLLQNIASAGTDISRRTCQRHHCQTATHAVQQLIYGLKLTVIPLISDKSIDRFAGFFQRIAGFVHDHVLDLHNVLSSSKTLHVIIDCALFLASLKTKNSLQAGFNIEHATGNIHQRRIGHTGLTTGKALYLLNLLTQNPSRLPQAQHRQRIANLFHDGQ